MKICISTISFCNELSCLENIVVLEVVKKEARGEEENIEMNFAEVVS